MARKLSILTEPPPVSKADRAFLKELQARVPVEGCEDKWQAVLDAEEAHGRAHALYDALYIQVNKESADSNAPSYHHFIEAGRKSDITIRAVMLAIDAYEHAVKHVNDPPPFDDTEVKLTIIDSLSDKLDELQFSINYGLLGSKLAHAIKGEVVDGFDGEPIMCNDCAT